MEARKTTAIGRRSAQLLLSLVLVPFPLIGSAGCAGFWDDVTSRDFHVQTLFVREDPLDVLAHSTDGDKRAKALRALHEPKQHGGTDQEQEYVLKLLTTAAVSERQPLCRLAAIQALGRFKDPRAAQSLIDAYYAVTEQRIDPTASDPLTPVSAKLSNLVSTFTPEMISHIQCQALSALGETRHPMAVDLLVTVAREPRPEGQSKQQVNDVRIAAARALGKFRHYQATATLVHVLKTEKDVALRDAAHDSLQAATGRNLPPDAKAWERLLHDPASTEATTSTDPMGIFKAVGFSTERNDNPLAPRNE